MNLQTIKATLTPQQMAAAELQVENEFRKASGEGRKQDEIAAECGVTRMTLYNWAKLPEYNAYMAYLSDQQLAKRRALVDAQLIKAIAGGNNGMPSIKAIELYFKLQGRLTEKHEVVTSDKSQLTQEQIDAGIDELAAKLREGGAGQ